MECFYKSFKTLFLIEVIPVQVLSLVQSSTFASGVELSKRTSLEMEKNKHAMYFTASL